MTLGRFCGVTCAALVATATSASALTISNGSNDLISTWGAGIAFETEAFGQTFATPVAGALDSIAFFIDDRGTAISFNANVYAWDGAKATGPALFTSGALATAGGGGLTKITVASGGIALSTGVDYVAFFQATGAGEARWGIDTSGGYAGGVYVYQDNDGDLGLLTSGAWRDSSGDDLAFAFEITPAAVPLPAALPLLAGALGLLGMAARRNSRAA